MKVTVMGTGYVGLVTGACLAEMGNHVLCLDVDSAKITLLRQGEIPIHEPGLEDIVRRNALSRRLEFTTDVPAAVRHGTIQIIGVGTPPSDTGAADLTYVREAARNIGRHMSDYKVVVTKSTVPVGTADAIQALLEEELALRGTPVEFSVVSNPEFLKEGAAVEDCMRPDRIILGANDDRALLLMRELYTPFMRNSDRMQVMDARSAEFTKYAANAMLATRISFMNELAILAEQVGVDIEMVRRGIGSDPRIGTHFLYPGTGYGGSCFPKDVKALIQAAQAHGVDLGVLRAVEAANERQKQVLVRRVTARFGERLDGLKFALWGLAFKPNTDDIREAPSLVIVKELLARGASVQAHDPIASREAAKVLPAHPALTFSSTAQQALDGAEALLIVTEWREYRTPDFDVIRAKLARPVIFDGRNLYDPAYMKSIGFDYHAIGRATLGAANTR